MEILSVKNLSKTLGNKKIIDNISFEAKEGEILGFLGPNGSGKTTTIRLITSLIFPDQGEITIAGHNLKTNHVDALREVGCVVENPDPYLDLSGLENLKQVARIRKLPQSEIDRVVKKVGLESRIKDKVKKYSLGMKQRLGVATALLGSPKLLILDEPTNGLDPDGMREFRIMIKDIAKSEGATIFLSSHLLAEVQQICDRVVFIEGGKIVATETMEGIKESHTYLIQTDINDDNEALIRSIEGLRLMNATELGYQVELLKTSPRIVIKHLVESGVELDAFHIITKDLESRYLEIVKGGIR